MPAAQDVFSLIATARERVKEQFGVELELEIELIGDWSQTAWIGEDRSES